tara:strand:- start:391 stop:786 length:396 start_codon:yes stop_codon:yes gene_type:complete
MKKHFEQKKQLREFGLLMGIGFPLIIGFLLPYLFSHDYRYWTFYIGIPILIFAIFKPYRLSFLYKKWISLGNLLGWLNSKIILGLIFFTILIPISFLMKIFGYDPLKIKKLNVISYRVNKDKNEVDLTKIF